MQLAQLVREEYDALNYDLMTRTRWTLDDLGYSLSWRALQSFALNLPPDSATYAATHDGGAEQALWHGTSLLPQLVAALLDEVRNLEWAFAQAHTKHSIKGKMPKPVPRPGVKQDGTRKVRGDVFESPEAFEMKWREVADRGKHRSW